MGSMKTVAEKLRELMKSRNLKPPDLAREMGNDPSRTTIYNWSSGTARPDLISALRLARYFDVSLDYLADDEMDNPPLAPDSEITEDDRKILFVVHSLEMPAAEAVRRLSRDPKPSQTGQPIFRDGDMVPLQPVKDGSIKEPNRRRGS